MPLLALPLSPHTSELDPVGPRVYRGPVPLVRLPLAIVCVPRRPGVLAAGPPALVRVLAVAVLLAVVPLPLVAAAVCKRVGAVPVELPAVPFALVMRTVSKQLFAIQSWINTRNRRQRLHF